MSTLIASKIVLAMIILYMFFFLYMIIIIAEELSKLVKLVEKWIEAKL